MSTPPWAARYPELAVAGFSFLLHFAWEILQTPLYAGMPQAPHLAGTIVCLKATLGDVMNALVAFWGTATLAHRKRGWLLHAQSRDWLVYLAIGILITIVLERLATGALERWAYAQAMPLVPGLGVGVTPLVQWLVVPSMVVWLARRHIRGAVA